MKKATLFLILFMLSTNSFAQYNTYSQAGNLWDHNVLETSDGGYLIAALEDCFIPGGAAIEGCIYAVTLIKTDAVGDTIWTNSINLSINNGTKIYLYENADNSFSVIFNAVEHSGCGIFFSFVGHRSATIINLENNGTVLDINYFPEDECELHVQGVVRMEENQYAIISAYETKGDYGGKLYKMSSFGEISNQIAFAETGFANARLMKTADNQLQIIYRSSPSLVLKTYDFDFNLISETTTSLAEETCLREGVIRVDAKKLANGDIGILCDQWKENINNAQVYRFSNDLELLVNRTFTLKDARSFVENGNQEIIIGSSYINDDLSKDAQVTYLSMSGDSIDSNVESNWGDQRVEDIIINANNELVLVGSVNCCNIDEWTGPSRSFLATQEQITEPIEGTTVAKQVSIYPNPSNDLIMVDFGADFPDNQYDFKIFNSFGMPLFSQKIMDSQNDMPISIDEIPPGLYFYSVVIDGEIIQAGQFLKSNY